MGVDLTTLPELCRQHKDSDHSLVMLLQEVQGRYGYLPREALQVLSDELKVSLARLHGLATFYRSFSLKPRGRHEVCVCTGTACHVRGATQVVNYLKRTLGVAPGETTADGEVTLTTVNCVGACALGPVVVTDGKYQGKVTVPVMEESLDSLRSGRKGAGS